MKLSEHFTLAELVRSYTATRLNIDNSPPLAFIEPLQNLAQNVLEPIRKRFRKPVRVNSGFRCNALNKAVGGAPNSQHMLGQAADIEIAGVPNRKLYDWVRANLDFDQILLECHQPEIPDSGWVHVSYVGPGKNRKQALEIGGA